MAGNPLHELLALTDKLLSAFWPCHTAQNQDERREAHKVWHALIDEFWTPYTNEPEAVRALADPALAWCSQRGRTEPADLAAVEDGVTLAVRMAKITNPVSIPSAASPADPTQKRWENEGNHLFATVNARDALRRLTAIAGEPYPSSGRLPWEANSKSAGITRPLLSDFQIGYLRRLLKTLMTYVPGPAPIADQAETQQWCKAHCSLDTLKDVGERWAELVKDLGKYLVTIGLADTLRQGRPATPRKLLLVDLDSAPSFAHAILCLAVDHAQGDPVLAKIRQGLPVPDEERARAAELVVDAWQIADVLRNVLIVDDDTFRQFMEALRARIEGLLPGSQSSRSKENTSASERLRDAIQDLMFAASGRRQGQSLRESENCAGAAWTELEKITDAALFGPPGSSPEAWTHGLRLAAWHALEYVTSGNHSGEITDIMSRLKACQDELRVLRKQPVIDDARLLAAGQMPFRPYRRFVSEMISIQEYQNRLQQAALDSGADEAELERVGGRQAVLASILRHLPDFDPAQAAEVYGPAWVRLKPLLVRSGINPVDETTTLTDIKAFLDDARVSPDTRQPDLEDIMVDTRKVFVIHGRNAPARDAVFEFLRALDLNPIEWGEAVKMTGKASPYIGEILDTAFSNAQAVVAVLTGDDLAYLREELQEAHDPAYERDPTPQARPNVLFEAGMAFGRHPDRTILIQIGDVRPFSDAAGRHIVHFRGSADNRTDLRERLRTASCAVKDGGTDWLRAGDFGAALTLTVAAKPATKKKR